MHGEIGHQDERNGENAQPANVAPQRRRVKAKGREDRGAGHLDVEPVLAVDQRQVRDLVDDEPFEGVVKD